MIIESLTMELKRLNKLLRITDDALKNVPDGTLRGRLNHDKIQYSWYKKEWSEKYPGGKYISKKDHELAEALARKEYNLQVNKAAADQIIHIETFLKSFKPNQIRHIYESFPKTKQILIAPYIEPEDLFLKHWYELKPGNKNTIEFENEFLTNNNEKVRSKSEKMIADHLLYRNIPYKYEAPLELNDGIVFPDFTIMNLRSRKEYYLEHLGRMDDPSYVKKLIIKRDRYHKSGYFEGETVLYTMESSSVPFDTRKLDVLIDRYFI